MTVAVETGTTFSDPTCTTGGAASDRGATAVAGAVGADGPDDAVAFASLDSWSGTVAELLDTMFDPTVTYADLAWIKEQWPGKVVVKGVQTVDDARVVVLLELVRADLEHAPEDLRRELLLGVAAQVALLARAGEERQAMRSPREQVIPSLLTQAADALALLVASSLSSRSLRRS